ncbi:MAG TPA: cation:proton antiporter [Pseudonocardiaceae bacterium]
MGAWLATRARQVVREPLLEDGISVLTPFTAYLIAEEIPASGVLAVVASGLALSQVGLRLVSARTRLQARAF